MEKHTTDSTAPSSPCWENLEAWARGQIQTLMQGLLEEEVTELLGRRKSARRAAVDAVRGTAMATGSRGS